MSLAELPQLQQLSTEEKIQLIDELWESIRPTIDEMPVTEEIKALLDGRWKAYLEHPEDVLTLEQVMKRVAEERHRQ
jgi:putative addiction module component (TIGR02574 family)